MSNNKNIVSFNNGTKRAITSKIININNNKEKNINFKTNEELKDIFNTILSESSLSNEFKYSSNDLLSIYIRKNRSKLNEILI